MNSSLCPQYITEHLASVQFGTAQTIAKAIGYNYEWVCTVLRANPDKFEIALTMCNQHAWKLKNAQDGQNQTQR